MTMQSVATQVGGRYQPQARRSVHNGNYHRIHEALLDFANKDGVFQSTEATNKLMDELRIGRSAAASALFQWSDPTGERGYRRVRLLTPRTAASDPPEMADKPPVPQQRAWARRAFSDVPVTNKNGPFYLPQNDCSHRGRRAAEMVRELFKFQNQFDKSEGFWNLRDGVKHMAGLGFNTTSVYTLIRKAVENRDCDKRGWSRRLRPEYVAEAARILAPFEQPEQEPGGVEPEGIPTGVDPLSDPNSFKGPKTQEMIDEERSRPVMGHSIEQEPVREDLRQKVEALVESTLSAPETIRAIDKLVGEAIIASAKRQLGVG